MIAEARGPRARRHAPNGEALTIRHNKNPSDDDMRAVTDFVEAMVNLGRDIQRNQVVR